MATVHTNKHSHLPLTHRRRFRWERDVGFVSEREGGFYLKIPRGDIDGVSRVGYHLGYEEETEVSQDSFSSNHR